ncbi:MAG TPA: restriction endonuclease, partial [Verrucomicrobiae bacterium]
CMLAGLIDIGVVILPSRLLYAHLTDRIGNWMELSPYLPLWHRVGQGMKRGLLAVTIVEHDELSDDPSIPFITQGIDGRSAEGAGKLS